MFGAYGVVSNFRAFRISLRIYGLGLGAPERSLQRARFSGSVLMCGRVR